MAGAYIVQWPSQGLTEPLRARLRIMKNMNYEKMIYFSEGVSIDLRARISPLAPPTKQRTTYRARVHASYPLYDHARAVLYLLFPDLLDMPLLFPSYRREGGIYHIKDNTKYYIPPLYPSIQHSLVYLNKAQYSSIYTNTAQYILFHTIHTNSFIPYLYEYN